MGPKTTAEQIDQGGARRDNIRRTMVGGQIVDSMVFFGKYDELINFLKRRVEQWANVKWATMNYAKYRVESTDINICIVWDTAVGEHMGRTLRLTLGQRLCVCEETKAIFVLDGETVGIEEEMTQPSKEGGERAGQADEGMEMVGNKNKTPLTQVSPADMRRLLNYHIKNKRVYVNYDHDSEPDNNVKVWVGEPDLPASYDEIKKLPAKYLINTTTERVSVIDHEHQTTELIGIGLGAIINLENDKKQ